MRILIVTDAAPPQVNGVVNTLHATANELRNFGHEVLFLDPNHPSFKTFPLPSYPEIRLTWNVWKVGSLIKQIAPDAIHVATEGTLGIAARIYLSWKKIPFTTSYHTKTPEYIKARVNWFPVKIGYAFMRWLHKPSQAVLVTTESMKAELTTQRLHDNLVVWSRGVDLELFNPDIRWNKPPHHITNLLYVGRVSVEKNIEAFLDLNIPDSIQIVVGDGPDRKRLKEKYPNAKFVGYKHGEQLAKYFADADVFVFPSKSDTFGIVMIEANACGTPVAAYPVTGPKDFVVDHRNGVLDDDLETAITLASILDRTKVRRYVEENYSWEKSAKVFENTLVQIEKHK
jgi:glycosyltransferase involved in cell wall biosynthesis